MADNPTPAKRNRPSQKKSKPHKKHVKCPYCGAQAIMRPTHDLFTDPRENISHLWVCVKYPECDSYVSAHSDGRPMGNLANAALRKKRIEAHHYFDQLWERGIFTRKNAYLWIDDILGLGGRFKQWHIGSMDDYMCSRVISEVINVLNSQPKGGRSKCASP